MNKSLQRLINKIAGISKAGFDAEAIEILNALRSNDLKAILKTEKAVLNRYGSKDMIGSWKSSEKIFPLLQTTMRGIKVAYKNKSLKDVEAYPETLDEVKLLAGCAVKVTFNPELPWEDKYANNYSSYNQIKKQREYDAQLPN
jgi:hypothetical protein